MRRVDLLEVLRCVQLPFPGVAWFELHEAQVDGVANETFGAGEHQGRVQ